MTSNNSHYVVCTRAGDPIMRPGRARLIWAANTAQATSELGLSTLLIGGPSGLPFYVDTSKGYSSCVRKLQETYNVDVDFDIALVYPPHKNLKNQEDGKWEVGYEYPRHIFPRARVIHTRDPRIAFQAGKRKIPFIYEDHCENFHLEVTSADECYLDSDSCLAVVAIAEVAKERLIKIGVPIEKIIVLDSGINKKTFIRQQHQIQQWRKFLLARRYKKIVVYTGGLQYVERGIDQIVGAMENLPDYLFVIAGGSRNDLDEFKNIIAQKQLSNLKIFGYIGQDLAATLQQAADVALLTRSPGAGAAITSPLKFFEYMASGTPIVSAKIPVLNNFDTNNLALQFYEPGNVGDLIAKINFCIDKFPRQETGYQENIEFARDYVWQNRQQKLLEFIDFC